MANEDPPKFSTRLWSEECAIADAGSVLSDLDPDKQPGYEFSNGRVFDSGKGAYESTPSP